MRLHVIAAALVGALLGMAGHTAAGEKGGKQPAFKTPEEAFQAAQKATAKGDWKAFAQYLAPETQEFFTAFLVVSGAVSKDLVDAPPGPFPKEQLKKVQEPLSKVFVKHGLTDDTLKKMVADKTIPKLENAPPGPDVLKKIAAAVKDRPGFIGEVMVIIAPVVGETTPEKTLDFFANKVLKDVKVEGDMATGNLVTVKFGQEQPGSQPIMFRRIDGSWRVIMPMAGAKKVETKPAEKQ